MKSEHLDVFLLSLAHIISCSFLRTMSTSAAASKANMSTSSRYARTTMPIRDQRTRFISRWNVAGTLQNPNGITFYTKSFCASRMLSLICLLAIPLPDDMPSASRVTQSIWLWRANAIYCKFAAIGIVFLRLPVEISIFHTNSDAAVLFQHHYSSRSVRAFTGFGMRYSADTQ